MSHISQIWLVSLLLSTALAAFMQLRQGWRWHAGGIAQLAIIAGIALYGLLVGEATLCAWLSWGLLFFVQFWPIVLHARFARHVALLDAASAREEAARMQLFIWGRPGRFWRDLADALALQLEGEQAEAEALVLPYLSAQVPRSYRQAARNNLYTLRGVARDWQRLLVEFETYTPDDDSRLLSGPALAAVRAYLELGDPAKARRVLERVDFVTERVPEHAVLTYQLQVEALAGALAETDTLVRRLALPPHAALPWRARALAANARLQEAHALMAEALASLPDDQPHLAPRLRQLDAELGGVPHTGLDPATPAELAAARACFERALIAGALLEPRGRPLAVGVPVAVIGLAFVPAHLYSVWPTERLLDLAGLLNSRGELTSAALHGEPWRLLTYQLLHADGLHLLLNLVILQAFGRQSVQLFGSAGFLAVFIVSGVGGGLAQVLLVPESHTIGVSGAVLGAFGAVIAGLLRSRAVLPSKLWRARLASLLAIAALQVALDQLFANQIAVLVHGVGLVAGCAVGLAWPLAWKR